MSEEGRGEPVRKLAAKMHNERLKLVVNALNAVSIALVGASVVLPVVRDANFAVLGEFGTWAWLVSGFALHGVAHLALGFMRSED